MALPNPYAQYRQTQVQTASPEQLVLMLYDGAIKFSLQSVECIENRKMSDANTSLLRVQDILDELMVGLNGQAGPIAEQLGMLYDYLRRRAVEANLKKDATIVQEIVRFLKDIRSTWAEAIVLAKQQVGSSYGRS